MSQPVSQSTLIAPPSKAKPVRKRSKAPAAIAQANIQQRLRFSVFGIGHFPFFKHDCFSLWQNRNFRHPFSIPDRTGQPSTALLLYLHSRVPSP